MVLFVGGKGVVEFFRLFVGWFIMIGYVLNVFVSRGSRGGV